MRLEDITLKERPLQRIFPVLVFLALFGAPIIVLGQDFEDEMKTPIYLFLAALVFATTIFDMRLGLVVVIAAIGMAPEVPLPGSSFLILRLEDFLVPPLMVALILTKQHLRPTGVRGPITLYLLVNGMAACYGVAFNDLNWFTSVLILGKFVEYFVMLWLVVNVIRTRQEVLFFTWVFIVIGVIAAAQGIFFGAISSHGLMGGRVGGPIGESPNIFAGYLAVVTGLCIGYLVETKKMMQFCLLGFAIAALFYTALLTFSRTGYVSIFAGTAIFGLTKRRTLIPVVIIAAMLFFTFAPDPVLMRARTIVSIFEGEQPDSYKGRLDSAKWAEQHIWNSPIFGNGLGFLPLAWTDIEYVRVLIDVGMVGLAGLLWLLFNLLYFGNQVYNHSPPGSFGRALAGGYILSTLCIMIHGLGATSFTSIRTMMGFIVISGIFLAYRQIVLREAGKPQPKEKDKAEEPTLVAIPESFGEIPPVTPPS